MKSLTAVLTVITFYCGINVCLATPVAPEDRPRAISENAKPQVATEHSATAPAVKASKTPLAQSKPHPRLVVTGFERDSDNPKPGSGQVAKLTPSRKTGAGGNK